MLLHGAVTGRGLYHRIFVKTSVSSTSHSVLMSQQSTGSVAAAGTAVV